MLAFLAAVVLGGSVLGCREYWDRLFENDDEAAARSYWRWVIRGLAVPLVLWSVFNSGLLPRLPTLVLGLEDARAAGNWGEAFVDWLGAVAFVDCGFWTAITVAWVLVCIYLDLADAMDLAIMAVIYALPAAPFAWACLYFWGWYGLGWAATCWLAPVCYSGLPLARRKPALPSYSRAIAKMKFGKYADAEREVIHQLEDCEDDYQGWMMLAELYARHFGDILEADLTIRELCEQPGLGGGQISMACHRLADWYLTLAADPKNAREALELIVHKLPGTHAARMAQQRIGRLPSSRDELIEQREHKSVRLPALTDPLDDILGRSIEEALPDRSDAVARANQCAERLREDPDNVALRERLAVILAEQLREVDLAVEQIELLMGMPEQGEGNTPRWLALIASWEIKYRQNWSAARPLLERLVHEYPNSPQAFTAQRRLLLEEREGRSRAASHAAVTPATP